MVNQKEMASQTGFSRRKVQRIIKKLADEGIIWRDGAKKNGKWRVREDIQQLVPAEIN